MCFSGDGGGDGGGDQGTWDGDVYNPPAGGAADVKSGGGLSGLLTPENATQAAGFGASLLGGLGDFNPVGLITAIPAVLDFLDPKGEWHSNATPEQLAEMDAADAARAASDPTGGLGFQDSGSGEAGSLVTTNVAAPPAATQTGGAATTTTTPPNTTVGGPPASVTTPAPTQAAKPPTTTPQQPGGGNTTTVTVTTGGQTATSPGTDAASIMYPQQAAAQAAPADAAPAAAPAASPPAAQTAKPATTAAATTAASQTQTATAAPTGTVLTSPLGVPTKPTIAKPKAAATPRSAVGSSLLTGALVSKTGKSLLGQ